MKTKLDSKLNRWPRWVLGCEFTIAAKWKTSWKNKIKGIEILKEIPDNPEGIAELRWRRNSKAMSIAFPYWISSLYLGSFSPVWFVWFGLLVEIGFGFFVVVAIGNQSLVDADNVFWVLRFCSINDYQVISIILDLIKV